MYGPPAVVEEVHPGFRRAVHTKQRSLGSGRAALQATHFLDGLECRFVEVAELQPELGNNDGGVDREIGRIATEVASSNVVTRQTTLDRVEQLAFAGFVSANDRGDVALQ